MGTPDAAAPRRRRYRLGARAEAAQQTRSRILQAAEGLFDERSFDDVAISDIAGAAGVSQQTVLNHFGSKDQLYLAGIVELVGPQITRHREQTRVGDVDSVIRIAVEGYERVGLGAIRMLAQAERFPGMAAAIEYGRQAHRDWVARVFAPQLEERSGAARTGTLRMLTVLLDVYTWYQLRHMEHRGVTGTRQDLHRMVTAVLRS